MKYSIHLLSLFVGVSSFAAIAEAENLIVDKNSVVNADSFYDALTQGKFKGLLRYNAMYRDSDLQVIQDGVLPPFPDSKKQQYSAVGGYLGYETAPWFNTSVGATFYSANPLGNNPGSRRGLGGLYEEDGGQDDVHVVGEVYIQYRNTEHLVKLGRQELNYANVNFADFRMTPQTHQAAIYENTSFDNLQINIAYIDKQKNRNTDRFRGIVTTAGVQTGCGALNASGSNCVSGGKVLLRGDFDVNDFNADGNYVGSEQQMPMIGVVYSTDVFTVAAWDYYVDDFLNSLYLHTQYNIMPSNSDYSYSLAAQYGNQQDVGNNLAGNIDTWFYGFKGVVQKSNGLGFFVSYTEVDYNEDSYDGGSIFIPWGGAPMFNSFQVQDGQLAGDKSYGVGVEYDFVQQGDLAGFYVRVRYADHNLPDSLSDTDARQDRTEATFDLRYTFDEQLKGLSILFRYAYNSFETDYDFDAYNEIHDYKFNAVTEDFSDVRLYVDYSF